MIAFSLSRLAFIGLSFALMLGMGASFLTGWLAALSQKPMDDLRAMAAARNTGKAALVADKAEDKPEAAPVLAPAAAPPKSEPDHGGVVTAPHAAPVQAAPVLATATPAEAPVAPPAKPQTKLAAALSQPMLRLVLPPAAAATPPSAVAATEANGNDLLRATPRELNAEFGRLGDPLRPVYTVEAGLFTADQAADALYQRLEAERYDVYRVDGGSYGIAVRVGAFDDRRLAEAAAVELRARQGLDPRVLRVAPAMMAELAKTMREGH